MNHSRITVLFLVQTAVLGCFAAGCGGNSLSKDDMDQGRKAVETFLATWKQGEPSEKLQEKAIIVEDPDWTAGLSLLEFQIISANSETPPHPRFNVKLTLKDEAGTKSEQEVVYETNARKQAGKVLISRDPFH